MLGVRAKRQEIIISLCKLTNRDLKLSPASDVPSMVIDKCTNIVLVLLKVGSVICLGLLGAKN